MPVCSMSADRNEAFLRTEMILGPAALDKLRRSHVAVFGLGGVGATPLSAWHAAALVL